MLEYIIKSGLCLMVLFSFYKIFMESEHFHTIKRYYLLFTLVVALILPLITITYHIEIPSNIGGSEISLIQLQANRTSAEVSVWEKYLPATLMVIYTFGFLVFAFRFYKNLNSLLREAAKNEQIKELNYIYILLGRKLDPHSFFNFIFLNKEAYHQDKISNAVLEHEKAHVDQKHSVDLLVLELLQIIFWFNPIFVLLKRSVKLNHEFLADERVLEKKFSPQEYSNILVQYSSGNHHNALSSPINHSLIKKRIIMITKSFSLRRLLFRSFIFLPVFSGCVYLFNEEIVAKPVLSNSEEITPLSGNVQQDKRSITIRVVGERIWLNKKEVSLKDFSEELNQFTSNWSQENLNNPWFEIDFENSTTEFIQKLNQEYRKTNISKISDTEFLAPSPVAPGANPPPPPPPPVQARDTNVPAPPAPGAPISEFLEQRENLFSIRITGNTLMVDGTKTDPKNFSKTLDKLSRGKTDEELRNYNFRMQIIDPAPGFIELLNQEFKKSRISKVTGHDILPPPPPAPPRPGMSKSIQDELEEAENLNINYINNNSVLRNPVKYR